MKKSYFLLLFFLATTKFYAQDIPIKVKSSPVYEEEKWNYSLAFSLDDGAGGLVNGQIHSNSKADVKGYRLEHYDANLNLLNEAYYELEFSSVSDVFIRDGKLNIIKFSYNKTDKTFEYIVDTSPIDNFNFTSKVLRSFSKNDKDMSALDRKSMSNRTKNGQSMAEEINECIGGKEYYIRDIEKDTDTDENSYSIKIYNDDFDVVTELELQLHEDERIHSSCRNPKTGTEYLLTYNTNKNLENKKSGQEEIKLYKIDSSGILSSKLSLGDSYLSKIKMVFGNDKLTLLGYCADKTHNYVKGITSYDVDTENLAIKNSVINLFDEEFASEIYDKKNVSKIIEKGKVLELDNYFYWLDGKGYTNTSPMLVGGGNLPFDAYTSGNNNTYLVAEDNSIYWIAENFEIESTSYTYFYKELVVVKINAEGQMEWAKVIHKAQQGSKMEFGVNKSCSYKAMLYNNSPLILLNAYEIETATAAEVRFKKRSVRDSNLYAVHVTSNGDFVVDEVFKFEKPDEIMLKPTTGWTIDNGKRIIIEGQEYGHKKKQLFEFSF